MIHVKPYRTEILLFNIMKIPDESVTKNVITKIIQMCKYTNKITSES